MSVAAVIKPNGRKDQNVTKKESEPRKQNACQLCLSRINAKFLPYGMVIVWYVSAQTNHYPSQKEMQYLPIPGSVKEMVSQKLAMGVTTEIILNGGL